MRKTSNSISSNDGKNESISSRNGQQNTPNSERTAYMSSSHRSDSYRVAIYGNTAEKEANKQQVREKLKEQVKEKEELHRKQLIERVVESDQAVALDQRSKVEDNETHLKKVSYLKQFRDENKKIMEEKERVLKNTREAETALERRLLNTNPINWNMTLH